MPLGTEVGLCPGHTVLDGDVVCPVLSVCLSMMLVYCGQTVGLIRMTLDMEVCLDPDHFVSDRVQLPPNSWPMSIVAKWMDGSRCHLVRR